MRGAGSPWRRWSIAILMLAIVAACEGGGGETATEETATDETATDEEPTEPIGTMALCEDREDQIPGDPYSPPCREWSEGFNGGATTAGVTDSEIIVAVPVDESVYGDSVDRVAATYDAYAKYFTEYFEFSGRSLRIEAFESSGDPVEDAARASELEAFAAIAIEDPQMIEPLVDNGIIVMYFGDLPKGTEPSNFVWAATGVCSTTVVPPGSTLAYAAFKEMEPAAEPTGAFQSMYFAAMPLVIGIHLASPDVTPATLANALLSLEPRVGPYGLMSPSPSTRQLFHCQ